MAKKSKRVVAPVVATTEQIRTLLLDVLRRAAHDWVLYKGSSRKANVCLANDAYVWLFEEGPGHPNWEARNKDGKKLTSFLMVCEVLDLDPSFVREKIRKLTPQTLKTTGRPADYRKGSRVDASYYQEHSVSCVLPSFDLIDF